jgi:signal transduction histidine kinase
MTGSDNERLQWYADSVARISELFVTHSDTKTALEEACRCLGEATGVSRTYIFENFDQNRRTCNTVEWVAPGIQPVRDSLQDFSYDDLAYWKICMERRESVVADNISDLPDQVRNVLAWQGIQSILTVPIYVFDSWFGFLGFDACGGPRHWSTQDMWFAHTVSRILGTALVQQRTRRELAISSRLSAIGRLSAGVAHEFSNIHAGMLGLAELLQEDPTLSLEAQHDVDRIIHLVLRAKNLTRRLLDVSQSKRSVVSLTLDTLLEDVISLMLRSIQLRHINIHIDNRAPGAQVVADRTELAHVIMNLMTNAIEAMIPQGRGEISLALEEDGETIVLRISDNGPGIPPEILGDVFDPFFTQTGKLGGGNSNNAGLGLTVARRFVESSGGTLTIHNLPTGGACCTISLPRAGNMPTPAKERPGPAQVSPGRILFVDADFPGLGELLLALRSRQHYVESLPMDASINAMRIRRFDLVVLPQRQDLWHLLEYTVRIAPPRPRWILTVRGTDRPHTVLPLPDMILSVPPTDPERAIERIEDILRP